jgi:hypothetical protein
VRYRCIIKHIHIFAKQLTINIHRHIIQYHQLKMVHIKNLVCVLFLIATIVTTSKARSFVRDAEDETDLAEVETSLRRVLAGLSVAKRRICSFSMSL